MAGPLIEVGSLEGVLPLASGAPSRRRLCPPLSLQIATLPCATSALAIELPLAFNAVGIRWAAVCPMTPVPAHTFPRNLKRTFMFHPEPAVPLLSCTACLLIEIGAGRIERLMGWWPGTMAGSLHHVLTHNWYWGAKRR